jgi:hypothetical protein
VGTHTISAASTPFQASTKQDDTPNTRYASPERPHACIDGINIDWFLMKGLERYGYEEHAAILRKTIVTLCGDEGFYEYFDPLTGMGHGSDLFSWSAALFLDVTLNE